MNAEQAYLFDVNGYIVVRAAGANRLANTMANTDCPGTSPDSPGAHADA